jgi:hypothetical protein
MAFMNEHEVERNLDLFTEEEVPNLTEAARVLYSLMRWVNANSDGWPYWSAPQRASQRLQGLLESHTYAAQFGHDRHGKPLTDVDYAEVKRACTPIKAFLTRHGSGHTEVFGGVTL